LISIGAVGTAADALRLVDVVAVVGVAGQTVVSSAAAGQADGHVAGETGVGDVVSEVGGGAGGNAEGVEVKVAWNAADAAGGTGTVGAWHWADLAGSRELIVVIWIGAGADASLTDEEVSIGAGKAQGGGVKAGEAIISARNAGIRCGIEECLRGTAWNALFLI
jgi:hypothetical protein